MTESVSTAAIAALCVSLAVMVPLPIVAALYLKRRLGFSARALIAGILAFTVSQVLIRMPLLSLISQQPGYVMFATLNPGLNGFLLAFSAALFEGGGRYVFMRLFMRGMHGRENGIGNGIAHGGVESMFLGVTGTFQALIYAIIINSGDGTVLLDQIPALEPVFSQLTGSPVAFFLLPGIERAFTVCLHTAVSVLFALGFASGRKRWFFVGIGVHTLVDCTVLIPNIFVVEGILLLVAAASVAFIVYSRKLFTGQFCG